jgi:copper transport protein
MTWHVVSADGHPIAGTIAFGVGTDATARVAEERSDSTGAIAADEVGRARAARVLRFLFYLAFVLAVGGALFRALAAEPPARVRRGVVAAAFAGIVLAALSLGARASLLLTPDAPLAALLEPAFWRRIGPAAGLVASFAVSSAGLALVAAARREAGPITRALGALGAVAAAAGLPLTGHAAAAEPRALVGLALCAHALVAAFWLGAFWPLRALLAERGARAAPAVGRFSALAAPAVGLVLAAGATLAAVHLRGDPAALLNSGYGTLVLA